jgi:two-component system sensor histidine kinase ChvG
VGLRRQLLLVSLLLLALPWAGCQYVQEMESALQSGQEQALLASTRAVATVLSEKPGLLYPALDRQQESSSPDKQLYALKSNTPIIVDGYADGWEGPVHGSFGPIAYRAMTRGVMLYLLLEVRDEDVVYHNPREAHFATGDRPVLLTGLGQQYVITTAAPGPVQARIERASTTMGWQRRIQGHWQDSLQGYTIELELPLALLGDKLGFYVVDNTGEASKTSAVTAGNIKPGESRPPWIIYPPLSLQALLDPFARSGIRLQVVDKHQWIIARAGMLQRENDDPAIAQTPWLMRAIYRAILNGSPLPAADVPQRFGQRQGQQVMQALRGEAAAGWYGAPGSSSLKLLSAAAPVYSEGEVIGVVIADENSEQYLSLTDRAFSRLLYYSLSAVLISAAGLLGYASWLSLRIRRLSNASSQVINADGSISNNFPVSNSGDEIGELSRQYAQLLDRLRDYTDYLRSLSRKLSHELRTPIAVIQSSLDNLEQQPEAGAVYLLRAREGLSRLGNILTAMSEASRLEESVHSNQTETFDLVALCKELCAAYRGVYTEHNLQLCCELEQWSLQGVPDLIAQMLDKLVDNAASFAPPGGTITITLRPQGVRPQGASPPGGGGYLRSGWVELCVTNEGPLLPDTMQQQLFDSMVSVRASGERVHLGLGLHIVRLIVDFHQGSVLARNLEDGAGVIFQVSLPGAS